MRELVTAYIGVGANLGDRAATLGKAILALGEQEGIRVVNQSHLYETDAIGPAQPAYLNAAIVVTTSLAPRALLESCQRIETRFGRKREAEVRHGPRPIDLDILLYEDEVIAEADLVIPHPSLHQRAFALVPLLEVAGDRTHPALGQPLSALLSEVGTRGVRKLEEFP